MDGKQAPRSQPRATEPRRTACAECRQQKLRCDVTQDFTLPCSRCRRKGISCEISSKFHRRKKRTKAQMQLELDQLKQQMRGSPPIGIANSAETRESRRIELSIPNPRQQSDHNGFCESSISHARRGSLATERSARDIFPSPQASERSDTVSQTLDGVEFEAQKIDDCFALFFKHYLPFLTVLNPDCTPCQYHTQSPLLFWAIVSTGARRYTKDTSIVELLAGRVINLAFSTLANQGHPLQTVMALLILCMWTFPIDTLQNELAHVLGGAAMQLSIKHGLHIFGNGQDFARTRLWPNASERAFRSQLWSYCQIICQSTSFCDGLPPSIVMDAFEFDRNQRDMITVLPPTLNFQLKIHKLEISAFGTILRNGPNLESSSDFSSFYSLVETFDSQVKLLGHECSDELDVLMLDCVRLHIRAYLFFSKSDAIDIPAFIILYSVAQSVIDRATKLDTVDDFALYCPQHVVRTVLLAAFTILKIYRGFKRPHLDIEGGKRSYFAAISFTRKRSLQNGDIDSRCAQILTQLWRSKTMFQKSDGTIDSLKLRIRSRLSMGVVFDCFWWWRAEYAGQLNPYPDSREASPPVVATLPEIDDSILLDPTLSADIFPDWEWAAGLTFPIEHNPPLTLEQIMNDEFISQ